MEKDMHTQYLSRGIRNDRVLFIQDTKTRTKQQYLSFCIKVGSLRNCVDDLLSLALNKDTYNRLLNICPISGRLKLGYRIYRANAEVQYM